MIALVFLALFCAAVPAILFARNLQVFSAPENGDETPVSILIPARDEELNIAAAVECALANPNAEVLVLDDASTDRTREIVEAIAVKNSRVRLLRSEPLPAGWCGKNFACSHLAAAATHPLLLFVDADVRLAPDGAGCAARALRESGAQLISGVPREHVRTFSEILLVPLIHFLLLGFLPLRRMRSSSDSAYATACGQLILVDADAYKRSGGHAAIRSRIHDGLALAKQFRTAGFRTDLFDATTIASCRMYRTNGDTWRGFAKNTVEGLGSPARIVPITLILLAGQVAPFALLFCATRLSHLSLIVAAIAAGLALLPRLIAIRRFQQPVFSALLHPIAIVSLLIIQWVGLARFLLGKPTQWKSRQYGARLPALALTGDGVPATNAREQFPKRV